MSDLAGRISTLSPERQQLLELLRKKKEKARAAKAARATRAGAEPLTRPFSLISEKDRELLPEGVEDAYPLSMVQLGMLYHMEHDSDDAGRSAPPAYHNVNSFYLKAPLDTSAFDETVQRVVARHPVLRTSFHLERYSEPLQLIHRAAYLPIVHEDLRHLPKERQREVLKQFILAENERLVDLANPPLIRFHLHNCGNDSFQFTLTEPHALADGWSTTSTLSEIFTHYFSLLRGENPPVLPPLEATFRDFVFLERQVVESTEARSFWSNYLLGSRHERLPRWPRVKAAEEREVDHKPTVSLPSTLVEGLENLARRAGVPLKSVLLTAHLTVLGRLTGSPRPTTGLTTHGRPDTPEGEQIRGLFLNTLPVHVDLTPGTWLDLIKKVFQGEREVLPFRRFPLAALQQLHGGQELFEALFTYLHFHSVRALLDSGDLYIYEEGSSDLSVTHFPLAATFVRSPMQEAGLSLTLENGDPDLSPVQVRAIHGYFRRVLESMVARPEASHLAEVLLSPGERHQLLVEWNDTEAQEALDDTLMHQPFEAWAAQTPAAVAAVFRDQQLSYGALEGHSNRLAHLLRSLGVGPGEMVAVYLPRCLEMVPALLGIHKAGGGYLPLEITFPKDRVRWTLDSLGVRALLLLSTEVEAAAELAAAVPSLEFLICLDSGPQERAEVDEARLLTHRDLADHPADSPPPSLGAPDDVAYIIFTSGSTGRPKGVVVRHRPVLNLIRWVNSRFGVTATDRVLFITSLCFDLSVYDVYGLLAAGGTIEIASDDDVGNPERLLRLMQERPITYWDSAPAALSQLAPIFPSTPQETSHLRLVFLSGDWIPVALPDQVRGAFPRAHVVGLGGATEATVWSNFFPVEEVGEDWTSIPYGRPIPNASYHVLDKRLDPCPIGRPGDLYIGGECLASGYSRAPQQTAVQFVPDPYRGESGAMFYSTGDQARFLPDGNIEFLGRRDSQVKIRGYRIELGEIETVLGQHPDLQAAVVDAREGAQGRTDKRLVAYVVPRAGEEVPEIDVLREHLLRKLPEYMMPAAFVTLREIPLTSNGKVNRRALPAPGRDVEGEETYVAPQTVLETRVTEIWSEVLEVAQVGMRDRFFDLGGHSLSAMRLVVRLREDLGVDLPLQSFFDATDVSALCRQIEDMHGAPQRSELVLPQVVPDLANRHEPFPLTDLQQGYWMGTTSAFALGNVSAHTYQEIDIPGVEVERLAHAWQRLVERHDALRLEVLSDGRQRILEDVPAYEIEELDLRGVDAEVATAELGALRKRMSEEGPDLEEWPLFELRCTHLEDTVRIHISLSLLISDAQSVSVLNRELIRLYLDPATELEPLDLSPRDYVLTVAALEQGEPFQRSLDYWQDRLPRLPAAPELPLATTPSSVQSSHMEQRAGALATADWDRLKARAAALHVTPAALLAAVYAEVLATWSRRRRFLLNLLYFNRLPLHPQVEDMAGNFSSTLLLEVDAARNESFAERVQRLQEQLWRDMDHSLVSGVRLQRELARQEGAMAGVIAPVVFASTLNFQTVEEALPLAAGGAPLQQVPRGFSHLQTPQVWLDHQVSEEQGELRFNWHTIEELFPAELMGEMWQAYEGLLQRLACDEEVWRAARPVATPPEQLAVREAINRTTAPLPEGRLEDSVRRAASKHPDQPALITAEECLSYGDLLQRADTLARRVAARGPSAGSLVAIVMEKGWEQLVGVLGILQAGATYLPIDPTALPAERVRYLLEQGRVEVAITRESWLDALPWPEGLHTLTVGGESPVEEHAVAPPADPQQLAYVLFTSGSTGFPKGVMIEHGSALNTVIDINQRFAVGPEDRVLAMSALSFDLSVYDVFGLLAAGGAVVLPAAEDLREPVRWLELMEEHRVTMWNTVPALMEMLVDHVEGHGGRLPESLRLVMMSGDWVPVSLPDRIRALGENIEVVSLGGATEASIWSILYPVETVDPSWPSVPYGAPMWNQQFHVLDDSLGHRPEWVPGDLYIAGTGLARGYWRDPVRTALSFVPDPTCDAANPGGRLYRTGDLGRYLPDGNIEFMGREDQQVKVQGYRIELGEIESTLTRHPAVRAAVVAALGPRRGSKRLVAYVVAAPEHEPTAEELRDDLANKLPAYMVPPTFLFLDELPLTANGKVDRGALPDPDARRGGAAEFVPPRDELEFALVRIWEEVLEHRPIGVRESFFDLGGHSLAAVRLMSQIARELGRELPLATLLEGSDIEQLAEILRREGGGEEAGRRALVTIQPQGEETPFFCVHPVGGDVLCYVELARRLGDERPFHALQTPYGGGGPEASRNTTIEEMAAGYVAAVREMQENGPYLLGGWSMGGVVAFEMAQQLRREGEEVAFLALMDASAPAAAGAVPAVDDATLASWFARDLGQLVGVDCDLPPEEFVFMGSAAQACRVLAESNLAAALPPGLSAVDLERHLEVFKTNFRALLSYEPQPYGGDLNLFVAEEAGGNARNDPAGTWRALAEGATEVQPVPGDHYTMFRAPHLEILAERLGDRLAQVGAEEVVEVSNA